MVIIGEIRNIVYDIDELQGKMMGNKIYGVNRVPFVTSLFEFSVDE